MLPSPLRRSCDVLAAVGSFSGETIVRSAEQAQVFGLGGAALAGGLSVVELQPGVAVAACALGINPAAPEPIAFEDRAARRARNGSARPVRSGLPVAGAALWRGAIV